MLKKFVKNRIPDEKHHAFATGTLRSLETLDDPLYASKVMGDGYAIDLTEGTIITPFSATVSSIHPAGHSIQLITGNGTEVLIFLGTDITLHQGEGIKLLVDSGDLVQQDQTLISLDLDFFKKHDIKITGILVFLKGKPINLIDNNVPIVKGNEDFFVS